MTIPAAGGGDARSGPVVVLSCAYSGASRVQEALAAGTGLGCTSGTGIIPMCATAAETWLRIEGQPGRALSPLAVSTIRGLVMAQMTVILAATGKSRWCELATASPDAAGLFSQVFPRAGFVCVHRSCFDVIRAGVRASPWGLQGRGLAPYLVTYAGNSVAALAAYWANSAGQLLAFERAHGETTYRVRYEDVIADTGETLAAIRACLGVEAGQDGDAGPGFFRHDDEAPSASLARVPAEMIPGPLLQQIRSLHAELGYPPPGE